MFKKISEQAQIRRVDACPVQIRDCSILYDKGSDCRYLQLEIENNSQKTLAALTILVVCYDGTGREVSSQEQDFYLHENLSRYRYQQPTGVALPDGKISRVSVAVQKVLAFQNGDSGGVVDITKNG